MGVFKFEYKGIAMKKWILWFCVSVMLVGCGGSKNASYVKDSSDYVSFGIDYHDIDRVIEKNTRSLLSSQYVRTMQGKKLLVIADIVNETSEDIDVELVARKLAREMRKTQKFTLTNAISGSGAKSDRMIKDSRKLTQDSSFNQRTTIENGTLEAPELSLSGKFVQRNKKIGKITRLDYIFLLTLSDIKSGKVLWDHEEIISKVTDSNVSSEMERQSEDKKLLALREQCKNEDEEACGTLFEQGDIKGLQKLCDEKVGLACAFAGLYFALQNDSSSAKLYLHKACELDNIFSCSELGILYRDVKNYTQAFRFSTKACDGGNMGACNDLGFLYKKGLGVKQNGAKALELYSKACESGENKSCYNVGLTYYFGNAGVKKDYTKARSYYTKACELDVPMACFNLGYMYANGKGGKKDETKALDLYEKDCDLGYGGGCNNAGILYDNKQQYGKARKLYEKGCELDNEVACYNLAVRYHNGQGARQEFTKAKELYGKACDLGYQDGCEWYKKLRDAGY